LQASDSLGQDPELLLRVLHLIPRQIHEEICLFTGWHYQHPTHDSKPMLSSRSTL